MEAPEIINIDASKFQEPIARLAETMAEQVRRYGPRQLGGPMGFHEVIFILVRQARNTYNFLCWVQSDELRDSYG